MDTFRECSQQTALLLSILFHKEYTTQMLAHLEESEGRVVQRKYWRNQIRQGIQIFKPEYQHEVSVCISKNNNTKKQYVFDCLQTEY